MFLQVWTEAPFHIGGDNWRTHIWYIIRHGLLIFPSSSLPSFASVSVSLIHNREGSRYCRHCSTLLLPLMLLLLALRWKDNTMTLEQRSLFHTSCIRHEKWKRKMCKKTERSEGFLLPFCLLVLLVVQSSILNFRFVNHLPTIHSLSAVKRLKKCIKMWVSI